MDCENAGIVGDYLNDAIWATGKDGDFLVFLFLSLEPDDLCNH